MANESNKRMAERRKLTALRRYAIILDLAVEDPEIDGDEGPECLFCAADLSGEHPRHVAGCVWDRAVREEGTIRFTVEKILENSGSERVRDAAAAVMAGAKR